MIASPTYKQLEARLRIGPFTIKQWSEMLVSGAVAVLFAMYVSPFGVGFTIFMTTLVAGVPVAISLGTMAHEWSVADAVRAQWRWLRSPRRRLPGPGRDTEGYRVLAAPEPSPAVRTTNPSIEATPAVQPEQGVELWDF